MDIEYVLINTVKKLSLLQYILIFCFLTFFVTIFTYLINVLSINFFSYDFTPKNKPFINNTSVLLKLLVTGLIAPVLETYLFQHLIINLFYNNKNLKLIIFISALLFGVSHFYDIGYVINTFFIGIVLATSYILWNSKKINPFWGTTIIHSVHNIIVIIISMILT